VNWIAGLQCSVWRRREVADSFYKRGKAVRHNGEEISTRCSTRMALNCARTVLDALLINMALIEQLGGGLGGVLTVMTTQSLRQPTVRSRHLPGSRTFAVSHEGRRGDVGT
jgi:hypothetical protein